MLLEALFNHGILNYSQTMILPRPDEYPILTFNFSINLKVQ